MAGMKPGFIAGANAKVKIFGKTLAYCQDVAYTVDVTSIPIESMGKYEVHSYEPVAYTINGSFSVIRYTKRAAANGIQASTEKGTDGNAPVKIGSTGTGNDAGAHLDPVRLLESLSFDLIISEKTAGAADALENSVYTITNCRIVRRSMTLNKRGVITDAYQFVGILGTDSDVPVPNQVGNSGPQDLV